MYFTAFDYVLLAVIGTLAVIGLFKGLSGWLGTLIGAVAATAVGYFGFSCCLKAAAACPWVSGPFVSLAATILDFLVSLVVFGLVRCLVVKFFTFLLPRPLNAIIGMGGGMFLGFVILVILAGTAFFEGVPLTEGFLASHSRMVHAAASILDSKLEGCRR